MTINFDCKLYFTNQVAPSKSPPVGETLKAIFFRGCFSLFPRSEERVVERSYDRVSTNEAISPLIAQRRLLTPTTLRWSALSSPAAERGRKNN